LLLLSYELILTPWQLPVKNTICTALKSIRGRASLRFCGSWCQGAED
jgi:hypothetical protein